MIHTNTKINSQSIIHKENIQYIYKSYEVSIYFKDMDKDMLYETVLLLLLAVLTPSTKKDYCAEHVYWKYTVSWMQY